MESGLVGLFLLVLNFALFGVRLIRNVERELALLLCLSLVVTFLWMTVINLVDIMLFYFAIMPSGLIWLLGGKDEAQLTKSPDGIINRK